MSTSFEYLLMHTIGPNFEKFHLLRTSTICSECPAPALPPLWWLYCHFLAVFMSFYSSSNVIKVTDISFTVSEYSVAWLRGGWVWSLHPVLRIMRLIWQNWQPFTTFWTESCDSLELLDSLFWLFNSLDFFSEKHLYTLLIFSQLLHW